MKKFFAEFKEFAMRGNVMDMEMCIRDRVNLGDAPYTVQPGDRIAQLMVVPVVQPAVTVVDDLDETERGAGGFGSTGR